LQVESTGKPLAGHSEVQPSQPKPTRANSSAAPASRPTSNRQTAKKPVKRPPLRFDNESSDDEPPPIRPGQTRHQGTKDNSPPPKRAGGGSPVAQGGGTGKQSIRIDADAARSLSKLLGVDPKTATANAINETIKSLSDKNAPQVGSSQRYSQCRDLPPGDELRA
ncbi:hypothetical protein FRC10_006076, partial [Ceratobasidium sp. 414]